MQTTIKIALAISLFSSVTFADGEMGSGGKNCPNGATTCFTGIEPTNGEPTKNDQNEQDESILTIIKEYLDSLFGLADSE